MEREEIVKKIVEIKSPNWEICFERLLNNYKEYYSSNVSLYKTSLSSSSSYLVYAYNFILGSETIIAFIKGFFGDDVIITSKLKNDNVIASILIKVILDENNKDGFKINAKEVFLDKWKFYKFISTSKKIKWQGTNIIFMRKKNTPQWYHYNWSLNIEFTDSYEVYNKYETDNSKTPYRIIDNNELMDALKKLKPYLNETALYDSLVRKDLILMKRDVIYDTYSDLYVMIPDAQVWWNDFEVVWAFNFYF